MSEQRAVIEFSEQTVGVWYVRTTPAQDWMAHLKEIVPEERYELICRFRNYRDQQGRVFDSDDEKHWYKGEIAGTRNFAILHLRHAAQKQAKMAKLLKLGGENYEYLNEHGLKEFFERFEKAPFVYLREKL